MVLKMKKVQYFRIIFFLLVFGFISISCLNAQSSNNEQRLVGTWTSLLNNATLVFNSNGSVTGVDSIMELVTYGQGTTFSNYAAAGDKILFYTPNTTARITFDYRVSSDGRTLILNVEIIGTSFGFAYRRN